MGWLSRLGFLAVVAMTVLIVVGADSQLGAHDGATGIVKERQQGMVAFKKAMKTWKLALDEPQGPTPETIGEISTQLSSHAGARLLGLYPENGPTKHTDASPRIWTEWAEFERLANALEARALALATVDIDKSVLRSEFKAIGGLCKAWHESFRER
jgi:cytochrome c556